jgi:hypothetical protein
MSAVLERFVAQVPKRPYCSDNPRLGVYFRPRTAALKLGYIQANPPWRMCYVPLDVDRKGAALLPEQLGLPAPTITTVNPDSTHAHFLFELAYPVWRTHSKSTGNPKSSALYQIVGKALALAYQADPSYVGQLTQNPVSPRWPNLQFDKTYTLTELADCLPEGFLKRASELSNRWPAPANLLDVASRNCDCFEFARHRAYRLTAKCASQAQLYDVVISLCREHNSMYPQPMRDYEVRAIAKSITRYCWKVRDSLMRPRRDGKRRGILQLSQELSLPERQRRGAESTNLRRRQTTSASIERALIALGPDSRINEIAKAAKVHPRTISRYRQQNAFAVPNPLVVQESI